MKYHGMMGSPARTVSAVSVQAVPFSLLVSYRSSSFENWKTEIKIGQAGFEVSCDVHYLPDRIYSGFDVILTRNLFLQI